MLSSIQSIPLRHEAIPLRHEEKSQDLHFETVRPYDLIVKTKNWMAAMLIRSLIDSLGKMISRCDEKAREAQRKIRESFEQNR